MGGLHFIGGEKGGVGKSFTSRVLAQYFIDSNKKLVAFDTDTSHATFSRFYQDFAIQVNVDEAHSLDRIIDTAERNSQANIIVDLAAQTHKKISEWISECGLFDIAEELGLDLYFWHVMDDGADSVARLDALINTFSDQNIPLVVVQNYGRGKSFKLFEQTETFIKAKEKGAKFLSIPKLEESLSQKIDFSNTSFWAAANNKDIIKITERHRVKIWLNFCYQQIERAIGEPELAIENSKRHATQEQSVC